MSKKTINLSQTFHRIRKFESDHIWHCVCYPLSSRWATDDVSRLREVREYCHSLSHDDWFPKAWSLATCTSYAKEHLGIDLGEYESRYPGVLRPEILLLLLPNLEDLGFRIAQMTVSHPATY